MNTPAAGMRKRGVDPVPYRDHTPEERQAYNRAAQRRSRLKKRAAMGDAAYRAHMRSDRRFDVRGA